MVLSRLLPAEPLRGLHHLALYPSHLLLLAEAAEAAVTLVAAAVAEVEAVALATETTLVLLREQATPLLWVQGVLLAVVARVVLVALRLLTV